MGGSRCAGLGSGSSACLPPPPLPLALLLLSLERSRALQRATVGALQASGSGRCRYARCVPSDLPGKHSSSRGGGCARGPRRRGWGQGGRSQAPALWRQDAVDAALALQHAVHLCAAANLGPPALDQCWQADCRHTAEPCRVQTGGPPPGGRTDDGSPPCRPGCKSAWGCGSGGRRTSRAPTCHPASQAPCWRGAGAGRPPLRR